FEALSATAEKPVERQKRAVEQVEKTFEQNMEKTRGAMHNYFSFLQNIWGSNDLTEKMRTYTEKNISASTEYIHKLSQAKSFPASGPIQTEFMQTQMNRFGYPARSRGEAYHKAATDATKPFRMST